MHSNEKLCRHFNSTIISEKQETGKYCILMVYLWNGLFLFGQIIWMTVSVLHGNMRCVSKNSFEFEPAQMFLASQFT